MYCINKNFSEKKKRINAPRVKRREFINPFRLIFSVSAFTIKQSFSREDARCISLGHPATCKNSRCEIIIVIPSNHVCTTIESWFLYRTMVIVIPYKGDSYTLLWPLLYHTMVIVIPYYDHCTTIQRRFLYLTMVIVIPYYDHCYTLLWPLLYHKNNFSQHVFIVFRG